MAKEKPILYTAEMILAKREGRKTVTRRVIKNMPEKWHRGYAAFENNPHGDEEFIVYGDCGTKTIYSPCQVGDLLWSKEALWESECGKYFAYGGYEHASVVRISDGRFYYGGDARDPINGKPAHRFMVGGYSNRDIGKGSRRKHRFILSIGEYDTTKKIKSFTGNTEITSLDILFTKKRSSRFMPKWAARTWLEVVSVRVERSDEGLWVWRYEFKEYPK